MTANSVLQIIVFIVFTTLCAVPLGRYIARVAAGERHLMSRPLGWLERVLLRLLGVRGEGQTWQRYSLAVILFSVGGIVLLFGLQMLQGALPLNPSALPAPPPGVAFNTAVSFVTNTNWQTYGGETTMSLFTQMVGLTVQNFLSAATGMAVLFALVRGFTQRESDTIGNFWVDLVRSTVHVLLPLALLMAIVFVGLGVVQTLSSAVHVTTLEGADQTLSLGPVASQLAIKQLGTNGGGFFNANSAHPFENPTALSNFLEMFAIFLIPAALCFALGGLVKDRRQGVALFAAMAVIFVPLAFGTVAAEQAGNPALHDVDQSASELQSGGNTEGKEVRFGITGSAIFATVTTAASCGAVNSMHDSYTPLGGMIPMWLMQLGEVVFGGVGSGLYGLLLFAIIAVFAAGLMVGRTPEYLGKKIEAREMKMASLAILIPAATVLLGTAIAVVFPEGRAATANPGAHGFSEILYAFTSGTNNNGSAFAGLSANGDFFAYLISAAMLLGRFGVILPILAIAGSLAKKKNIPVSIGTLPTHGPLFVGLLVGAVVLVGALTFIPSLALGPVVEHLQLNAEVAP